MFYIPLIALTSPPVLKLTLVIFFYSQLSRLNTTGWCDTMFSQVDPTKFLSLYACPTLWQSVTINLKRLGNGPRTLNTLSQETEPILQG